nr:uncharacterized protein LOC117452042 [Pseudochaenichthys georgianus]
MDSADSQTLRAALCSQAQRLRQQEEEMKDINQGVMTLTSSQTKFSGESGNCSPFLTQCDLHFTCQPAAFPSDLAKVAFVVSHLTGRAEAWATADMIALAIRTDTRLQERRREKARKAPPPARSPLRPGFRTHNSSTTVKPASGNTEEEPMQLGRARLSPEEKQRRLRERLCFYCGKQGHFLGACPLKDGAYQGKTAEIVREPIIDNDREHEDNQDSDFPDLSNVPSCYRDLKEVFNKTKATSLPPHRTYDCAIDLLPGSPLPKGRLYSLSAPERESMREYIDGSLKTGLIRPSSSPAGAGFFFVEKKDGSLRPCIDYSPLNDITIKNRYPLPLMTSTFELLKGARVFSKLDLRNAYHLVRIREGDEWKTGFNTPSGHYEYLVHTFRMFVRY